MRRVAAIIALCSLMSVASACHLMGDLEGLSYADGSPGGGTTTNSSSTSSGSTPTATGGSAGAGGTTGGAGPGGGTGAGGAGGGGAGGSPPCHPPGLTDRFDGSALDTTLWTPWNALDVTVGVAGGMAFIQPATSTGETRGGSVASNATYDLSNCSIWIEVVSALNSTAPGGLYFEAWVDGSNDAEINIGQGAISFEIEVDAGYPLSSSIPYSPTEHRWLRIRENAGTLYEETSPDGVSWTEQGSASTPWWIGQVTVRFGADTWGYTDTPGRAEFDNVNLLP